MVDPELDDSIPEIDLNLKITKVSVKPRKLNTTWSVSAASELYGPPPKSPLQKLVDELEQNDPNPLPNESPKDYVLRQASNEELNDRDRDIFKRLAKGMGWKKEPDFGGIWVY